MLILYPILGILIGWLIPQHSEFLQYFDVVFLKLLYLVVPFLIFSLIVKSICYLWGSISQDSNILWITLYYLFGTLLSIIIGFVVVYHSQIGVGNTAILNNISVNTETLEEVNSSLITLIVNILPANIIHILYKNDLMALFVTACLIGVITYNSQYKQSILAFFDALYNFCFEIIEYILCLIPYALLSLFIKLTKQGLDDLMIFAQLLLIIFILYIIRFIIMLLEIYFIGGISPLPFILKSFKYQTIAFISTSSKATLPIATKDMNKMGVSPTGVQQAVSIGGMFNAIGFGLDLTVIIVFILNLYGVDLNLANSIAIIILSFLGVTIGNGIPAAPMIVLGIVLNIFNIPLEVITIIMGADRIIDMCSTVFNITGICAYTLIIDSRNNRLDKDKYYS